MPIRPAQLCASEQRLDWQRREITMNRTLLKRVSFSSWHGPGWPCCAPWWRWRRTRVRRRRNLKVNRQRKQGPRTDGQIEMDVVHALDASQALKNDLITAATIQSEVTLSGTVSSDASKQLAESIASHVDGVTKVHNNLTGRQSAEDAQAMQPAPDTEAQEMPDSQQAGNGTPACRRRVRAGPGINIRIRARPPQAPYPPQQPPVSAAGAAIRSTRLPRGRSIRQYPQYRGNIRSVSTARAALPRYKPARGPVTIPQGTLLQLRTSEPVDSKRAKDGEPVQFTVIQDVAVGGVLAIPRGATVHGVVTESKNVGSGDLGGSSVLALSSLRSIWADAAIRSTATSSK